MATEKLIVELDASTQKLDKSLQSTNKKLDSLDKQTKKNDGSFNKLTATASAVGSALTATVTAGFALATALTAVVLKSAAAQQELTILSRQAKLSTLEFEALAFSTKQYGINAEQIADISKDLGDKLGEFSKVGTGAFQDFADVVGLTKEQAMALASEFENMSSDQVIGEMVARMEEAGASGNQMTFVLESMGNDLSRLIPLFADGSKELKVMMETYKSATAQMKLSAGEIEDLQVAATSFDLMTDSLTQAGSLISAQIAPLLTEFFNGVIEVVPDATQTVINFINSFRDAEDIKGITALNEQIEISQARISELRQEQMVLGKTWETALDSEKSLNLQRDISNKNIAEEEERIRSLIEARDEMSKQQDEETAKREKGGVIGGSFDGGTGAGTGTGDQIQAIADRFLSEEELLSQKLERELILVGENNELKLALEQEYLDNIAELRQEARDKEQDQEDDMMALFKDNTDEDAKLIDKRNKDKEKSNKKFTSDAMTLSNLLFGDNKLIASGEAAINTYQGVTKALSKQDYAGAALTAAIGLAQIAKINATEKGSSGGGSGGISKPAEQPEPTSELLVSDLDASGLAASQTLTIKVDSDDSELAVALNGILGTARTSGVIS